MKRIILIMTMMVPLFVWAQTENDMYDISSKFYQGTAKSAAMGNAMGAVGSDFSSISINPAGLGLFRKATLTFTPEFYAISTESGYKENNSSDRAFKMPMNNLGMTWTWEQETNDELLKTVSFAFGINSLNNYAYSSYVNGNNPNTSLIDAYFSEFGANGITNNNILENYSPNSIYPLWQTYLIDFYDNGSYSSPVPQGGLNQQYGVTKSGRSRELTFASGFNIDDKLFLGLSVNIPYFRKSTTNEYKERNLNYNDTFKNWTQQEYISNSGSGVNANLGFIVFPARWIRLGASFHTPSLYKVTESWYTSTSSVFSDASYSYTSPTGTYTYTITTPYRLNASAALIFGNFGMISGDYEFVDYRKMRASSYDYNYSNFNDFIRETFSSTSNIRIGTEWRWQTLCFRAGYAIYGSPFGFDNENLRTNSYSCGLGYTYHRFTIDAAYVLSQRKNQYDLYSKYSMYPANYGSENEFVDDTKVKETTSINQVVVSFKFRLD